MSGRPNIRAHFYHSRLGSGLLEGVKIPSLFTKALLHHVQYACKYTIHSHDSAHFGHTKGSDHFQENFFDLDDPFSFASDSSTNPPAITMTTFGGSYPKFKISKTYDTVGPFALGMRSRMHN